MEVAYDLDTEARATAEKLGLGFARAATAGVDPRFVAGIRDLLLERAAVERGEQVERKSVGSLPPGWDLCEPGCCANSRGARPALVRSRMNLHEHLGDLALDLAVRAAELAEERRLQGVEVTETKSSSVDIVTETDQDIERFLRRELSSLRPGDGFVGEEGNDVPSTTGVSWVVDPIDGTVNFVYGIPRSAVSIGVRDGEEMVAGAVVNIMTGDRYTAVRGFGRLSATATRSGPAPVPPMDQRLVHTGFGYRAEVRARQGAAVARMLPLVRDIRRQGSAALDLCDIACGRADAYLEEGLNLWDYAAAGVIAEEAGARVFLGTGSGGATFILAAPRRLVRRDARPGPRVRVPGCGLVTAFPSAARAGS